MKLTIHIAVKQKTFQYNGYSVLVQEGYMPYDSQGHPSHFFVFFVNQGNEMILSLISRIDFMKQDENSMKFFEEHGLNMFIIKNKGLFSNHDINWAIEEAKKVFDKSM